MWWGAHNGMGYGMGWWMLFGGLWMLLFWGAVVALVVWGIRALGDGRRSEDDEKPLRIAERRFARGEITREELEQIRQVLRR